MTVHIVSRRDLLAEMTPLTAMVRASGHIGAGASAAKQAANIADVRDWATRRVVESGIFAACEATTRWNAIMDEFHRIPFDMAREIDRLRTALAVANEACAAACEGERVLADGEEGGVPIDPTDVSYDLACVHCAAAVRKLA